MKVSRGRCLLLDRINEKGWTQAEYGRRAGRSKRMISHFCAGKRVMQPEDIYAAQIIFDCTLEQLYEIHVSK